MAQTPASHQTIFFGPFVHCATLSELDICESGAIGVDAEGIIAFVERDVTFETLDQVSEKHGWTDCKVVRIYDTGFFFPGFIGKCYMSFAIISSRSRGMEMEINDLLHKSEANIEKTRTFTLRNTQMQASSANRHSWTG